VSQLPPSGFYIDPNDPSRERWWDGGSWGEWARPPADVGPPKSTLPERPLREDEYMFATPYNPAVGQDLARVLALLEAGTCDEYWLRVMRVLTESSGEDITWDRIGPWYADVRRNVARCAKTSFEARGANLVVDFLVAASVARGYVAPDGFAETPQLSALRAAYAALPEGDADRIGRRLRVAALLVGTLSPSMRLQKRLQVLGVVPPR
jgi:hypothetical protein